MKPALYIRSLVTAQLCAVPLLLMLFGHTADAQNNTDNRKPPHIVENMELDAPDWEPAGFLGGANGRWSGSIMFSLKDLNSLNKVFDARRRGIDSVIDNPNIGITDDDSDDPLNRILEELAESQYEEDAPKKETAYFYLGSIMYISPGNWSVWLNGKRITQSTPDAVRNITVTDVSKNMARFRWKPYAITPIRDTWNKKLEDPEEFKRLGIGDFNIRFNRDKTVTFTLHPNQTLYTDVMEVVEGRRMEPRSYILNRLRSQNNMTNGTTAKGDVPEAENSQEGSNKVSNDQKNADKLMNQYLNAGEALGLVPQKGM